MIAIRDNAHSILVTRAFLVKNRSTEPAMTTMKWCFLRRRLFPAVVLVVAAFPLRIPAGDNLAESASRINDLLSESWEEQAVTPNPVADDETFVRRIYLDITGRIPTRLEVLAFLESDDVAKRSKLIDQLLESDGYAQHFFNFWADILRVQSNANGGQGAMTSKPYLEHLKRRVRENQPYDEFVYELLSARGKVWENPAIGYYMRDIGMPLDNLAITSRIFLGTRIECAQCHNHPFDKWTQKQFYELAAFTFPQETNHTGISGMEGALDLYRASNRAREAILKKGTAAERAKAEEEAAMARWVGKALDDLGDFVRYSKVESLPKRQLKLPHDYQYEDAKPHDLIAPASIFGQKAGVAVGDDPVPVFAGWVASAENPRFTTVIANRLWKRVFGLGLMEPVDELLDTTAASNPELMTYLEELMVSLDYDMKAFQRVLFNTDAYQREAIRGEPVMGEPGYFTGPLLRRLTAEQIWDSFVTLVHPTPDLPRVRRLETATAERIAYRRKLSDALDTLSSRELFDGAMKASRAYETISARAIVLREEHAAALKAKDKPLIEKLTLEIRALEFNARSSVNDHLVVPAVARLYTRVTGKEAPPPVETGTGSSGGSMMNLKNPGQQRQYIGVPGYDPDDSEQREEEARAGERLAIFREEAERFGIPSGELDRFIAARENHVREWVRAADLESPAPRGHYLREFGQSDRGLVENANSEASMPQALVLMNSPLIGQILSPYTQLTLGLDEAATPEAEAEVAYLSLLARRPSAVELSIWAEAGRSGLESIEDLVFALVNSRQFIFVK